MEKEIEQIYDAIIALARAVERGDIVGVADEMKEILGIENSFNR